MLTIRLETQMQDCIFCKIIKKEIPSTTVFENEEVVVFKNIHPVAEVHLLVVPKTHVSTFLDIDGQMESLVKATQEVVKLNKLEDGYKIVINGGKYQSVPHIHLHLLSGKLEDEHDILNNT